MKQSGGSSGGKSPDVSCLDDDTLIAKTILGISTLQLEMMNKIKKLEDTQHLILEETRLERAKHQAIIEAMEKHYDKEMDRFMEMVNLIVDTMKRREQQILQQPTTDAARAGSQMATMRAAQMQGMPQAQAFNAAATPAAFFGNPNVQQSTLQTLQQLGLAGMNQQMPINYMMQAQQMAQHQMAQYEAQRQMAQAMAAASQNGHLNAAMRGLQPAAVDASSFAPAVTTSPTVPASSTAPANNVMPSGIPASARPVFSSSRPAVPVAVTSSPTAVSKSAFTSAVSAFKPPAEETAQEVSSSSFKPSGTGLFGGATSGGFAALAAKASSDNAGAVSSTAEKKTPLFQGLTFGTAAPVKSIFAVGCKDEAAEREVNRQDDDVEEFVPTADFKPVIPLPPLIEEKTGEEDEKVLFKSRAKLFRFVKATNEYKERGVGDIKILQNKENKCRVVMRRDQVLKVCANTPIIPGMKINKKPGTENACIWACKDYSEETNGTNECFVVRLKTAQLADEFIKVFDDALRSAPAAHPGVERISLGTNACSQLRDLLNDSTSATSTSTKVEASPPKKTEDEKKISGTTVEHGFGDAFKAAPGSWECKSCYVRNAEDKGVCLCCGTRKDGAVSTPNFSATSFMSKPIVTTTTPQEGAFSFGITTGVPFPKSATATPPVTASSTTSTSVSFGFSPASSVSVPTAATSHSTTQGSNNASGSGLPTFSFSPLSASKVPASIASPASTFSFSTTTVSPATKSETTTIAAAPTTAKPSFSFAKPSLPVTTTSTSAFSKSVFSVAPTTFNSAPQEASKNSVSFSFKPNVQVEAKPAGAGPVFGGSPVFGGKSSLSSSTTTTKAGSKEGSPAPAKPFGNSLFGASASTSPFSGSVFGGTGSGGFAALAAKAQGEGGATLNQSATEKKMTPFGAGAFGGGEKSIFSLGNKKEMPANDGSPEVREEDAEEFVPTVDFKPVIPLPPLVEGRTGEEDEDILYKARAKLYRFVKATNEYKERGVGDIKILKNKEGQCRVVMRRDQVLKVCANTPIRSGMRISKKPGTDNTCMWASMDYSEVADGNYECFVARFKTPQLADEFLNAYQTAVDALSNPGVAAAAASSPPVAPAENRRPIAERISMPSSSSKDVVEVLGHSDDGSAEDEDYEDEENEYEELKNYPATVNITDAFPSPMRPSAKMEVKGMYAIGIRHDMNAMEIDVLDSEGVSKLSHTVSKDDKFNANAPSTLEYITINDEGKNVKVAISFEVARDRDEALGHLQKGISMAAENED